MSEKKMLKLYEQLNYILEDILEHLQVIISDLIKKYGKDAYFAIERSDDSDDGCIAYIHYTRLETDDELNRRKHLESIFNDNWPCKNLPSDDCNEENGLNILNELAKKYGKKLVDDI